MWKKFLKFQVIMFMSIVVPVFLDDNAQLLRKYVLSEYVQTEDIFRMVWLAYLPDLKWIEHVWDTLVHRHSAQRISPGSFKSSKVQFLNSGMQFWKTWSKRWNEIKMSGIHIYPRWPHTTLQKKNSMIGDLIFLSFSNFHTIGFPYISASWEKSTAKHYNLC